MSFTYSSEADIFLAELRRLEAVIKDLDALDFKTCRMACRRDGLVDYLSGHSKRLEQWYYSAAKCSDEETIAQASIHTSLLRRLAAHGESRYDLLVEYSDT